MRHRPETGWRCLCLWLRRRFTAFAVGDCCRARAAASAWLNIARAIALGSSLAFVRAVGAALSVAAGAAASVAVVSCRRSAAIIAVQGSGEQLQQAQAGLIGRCRRWDRCCRRRHFWPRHPAALAFLGAVRRAPGLLRRWRPRWLRKPPPRHRARSRPARIVVGRGLGADVGALAAAAAAARGLASAIRWNRPRRVSAWACWRACRVSVAGQAAGLPGRGGLHILGEQFAVEASGGGFRVAGS